MIKRLPLVSLFFALFALLIPNLVNAGAPTAPVVTIAATTSTSIEAGGTVSFSVTYRCSEPSGWNATIQLINDTNETPLGSPQTVTWSPSIQSAGSGIPTETAAFTLTFTQPGTYPVGVEVTDEIGCQTGQITGAPINVTVSAAATTTVAPTTTTTTVAPTTTEEQREVLPATGSDNTGLFAATGVALAGAAILISRRRLLTK